MIQIMRFMTGMIILLLFHFNPSHSQDSLSSRGARIEFRKEAFDFGSIEGDSTYYHVFYFKNTGTDTLKIQGVRAG